MKELEVAAIIFTKITKNRKSLEGTSTKALSTGFFGIISI